MLVLIVVAALSAAIYYLVLTKPNMRPSDFATEPRAPVSERDRGYVSGSPDAAPAPAQGGKPPTRAAAPRDNPLRRTLQQK
ncbi:MAG: hypothetical protein IAG13_32790, partial [Deltaproteobacteria bacterium]|nr:hypothetical protein [Nannocystaceae bacterium]